MKVQEDRERLVDLMDRMHVARNPIKQATGWLVEKTSRVKFSGMGSGEPDQSAFMALESLTLGGGGKGEPLEGAHRDPGPVPSADGDRPA